MMIAIILFINLSAIYCQSLFPDEDYGPTFKRFISPSLRQTPFTSAFGNLRSQLPFQNEEAVPNFEASTGFKHEGQGLLPKSMIPTQEMSQYPPRTPNFSTKESLSTGLNIPSFSRDPQSYETILRAKLSPKMSQMLESARSMAKSSFNPTFPSNSPLISSPVTTPPVHSPRPAIVSPLTLTDSIPSPYLDEDPIINPLNAQESILTSNIGCLDLTVTPYGTISETPLPDPSIPIPRSQFLPVSSPVSALAPPLSPFLPPASPASKGSNFLRKVPVPPPFI